MNYAANELNILIVEDDPRMLELLCRGLRESGHTVMPASDGESGLDLAKKFCFDVVVLDLGLPLRDGFSITASLRETPKSVPILILTARDSEDDLLRGFDLGADDYLVKPFSFPELVARLEGLARLSRRKEQHTRLLLDPTRLTVQYRDTIVQLTRMEYLLLATLVARAGSPVSRRTLIESIWSSAQQATSNTLEVLVNSLRGKLNAVYKDSVILTVRGVGYRLQVHAIPSLSIDHCSVRDASA